MKTKKLFSITSAIAGVLLAGSTVGALAQTSLYVDNPGFELPATGKISAGFDVSGANDIPGWMDAGVNTDSGTEWAVWGNSGSYSAYCKGGDAGAYQITTNTMAWGKKYTLTWSMAIDYIDSSSSQTVSILSADATNTPYASCAVGAVFSQPISGNYTYHGAWSQYSMDFVSGNAQVGKYIGMGFRSGTQWISFDDFALTVQDASPAELQVSITTQPVGVSVYEGESIVLTVAASGPDPVYQWKAGAQGGGIYTNLPGATSATLTIPVASLANTADYVVSVSNPSNSVTSSVATVTVAPAPYVNGLFNGDFELPNLGKISSGFDVSGSDAPGWKNAGPNQNDSGIDTSGHTGSYCAYVQKGQSGAYQITTNVMQQGSTITMTWWERNEWQNLTAKVSLLSASSQAAAFGSTTVLVSQTNALGNGNTDFNWHQRTITYTAGAGDAGKLLGVAIGSADVTTGGWGGFDDFSIVVLPPSAPPVIAAQPASQTVWLASTATIPMTAAGSGLSYQWKAGAVGSGIYTNLSNGGQFSGVHTNILTIANVAVANGLDYIVTISNTGGSTNSDPATLTVNTAAPNIGTISSKTVFQYDTTTLSPAYADGATTYQWQAGAVGSGIYTNLSNGGRFSGVNSNILTITTVQLADGLDYVLVSSNAGGSSTNGPATLTVTPDIYFETFTANGPTISGIGWLCDARSGLYDTSAFDGTRLIAYDPFTPGPQAFYTTTKLDNGSTGVAFPVINLTNVTGLTFSVDVASSWHPENIHMFWAVQMNGGQWYVSATEMDQASGSLSPRTLTVDTNASAWNDLTVSGTGGTNTASIPLIGSASTTGLIGYMTGIGLVATTTGTSWVSFDNLTVTGDGFTILPGLSLAPSGANVVLTWGYGTLVESTNVTGPWTPASGTSPKTVSPTGGSRFYGLQLP